MADSKIISNLAKAARVSIRDGYGEALVILGGKNPNVTVLCADVTESTRAEAFRKKFPDRFIQVGVAEQNLAAVASGMSAMGKIPFISSYAIFSPGRNWEQIRTTIAYNEQNVKIAGTHAGVTVGPDGATHQALEDIALMRVLPKMTVVVPCDVIEARKATIAAAKFIGPAYLRLGREKTPVVTIETTQFEIGKAEVFRHGEDCAIIACGVMVFEALLAAQNLEKEDIHCTVINCHTIKPLDRKTIIAAARDCNCVVTAEEHQVYGGLGSAVAELLSQTYLVPVHMIGVKDRFGQSGNAEELMNAYGLTFKEIEDAVRSIVRKQKMKCEELHESETALNYNRRKLLEVPRPELFFKLKDGGVIKNIPELKKAVNSMKEEVYSYHVNDGKNDFASWIRDVFNDTALAENVQTARTKSGVEKELRKVLRELYIKM
ncbi:MAG: transketolase family protein [Candidatus Aenigmarchaeota archaeon]|nr:transketolase family protein [Candidatus Aenigmarchaeota archaeon]